MIYLALLGAVVAIKTSKSSHSRIILIESV